MKILIIKSYASTAIINIKSTQNKFTNFTRWKKNEEVQQLKQRKSNHLYNIFLSQYLGSKWLD